MNDKRDTQEKLAPLRLEIDKLDQKIIAMLNERARVVVKIGDIKRDDDSPIYAPDREQRVLEQIRKYNIGPLPNRCVEAIWRELMSGSFALEKPLRIGFLGPIGSYSHLAAVRKFGHSVEYDGLAEIEGVFEAVMRGHVDIGLVPIENSYMGGIGETLDSFLEYPVQVYAEVLIAIHHNLLSNHSPDEITKVYSKPVIFEQCRKWCQTQLSGIECVSVASSAKAAMLASKESHAAAIGSELASELYDLKIQLANIEDNPNNTTRFFIITKNIAKPSGDDKTAVMFTTEHKAGALTQVLDVFRDHGLNLTHIDKRPSKRVNWEYYFFVDFLGHQSEPNVAEAIEKARKHCLHLSVLGSFPRAEEVL